MIRHRAALVKSFCTALKPPASPAAGATVGRACGLRPVPPSAAPNPEESRADLGNWATPRQGTLARAGRRVPELDLTDIVSFDFVLEAIERQCLPLDVDG